MEHSKDSIKPGAAPSKGFALLPCLPFTSKMKFTTAAAALSICTLATAKTWVLSERLAVSSFARLDAKGRA